MQSTITLSTVQTTVLQIQLTETDARAALADPRPLQAQIAGALGVAPISRKPRRAPKDSAPKKAPAAKAGAPQVCPEPTCRKGFKTLGALRIHQTRMHSPQKASAPAVESLASA